MMEKCFDEGTLQAFLDNELEPALSQRVAGHVVGCDPCGVLLAEVEEETAFALSALHEEFNTLVPTFRLWTKINGSIESEGRNRGVWQKLLSFASGLSLLNPQAIAFGSLLLIAGVVSVLLLVKGDNTSGYGAHSKTAEPAAQTAQTDEPAPAFEPPDSGPANVTKPQNETPQQSRTENVNYAENSRRQIEKVFPRQNFGTQPAVAQYFDGEESYVNTIARLEKTVDGSKDEVLRSSARFAFEKDLAVVNDTISKMKREAAKDPKNEDAKQVLFSSYQNKIELLNSVTQRGELMASLR